MSIDRRLRSASNALREVELAVPERVPRGSRSPAMALPVLMLVFGAALAMTGLDRTPGSEPVPEGAAIAAADVDTAVETAAEAEPAAGDTRSAATLGASDIDRELQLIRELQRRTERSRATGAEPISVAAPDANAELELIRALVDRPARDAAGDGADGAADATVDDPSPSPPMIELS